MSRQGRVYKRPPFSRTAKSLATCGRHVFVMCGVDAWEVAQEKQFALKPKEPKAAPVLVCPPETNPYQYGWPVGGLDVTVLDSGAGDDLLSALGRALIRDGATLVAIVPDIGKRTTVIFRPQETRNVA